MRLCFGPYDSPSSPRKEEPQWERERSSSVKEDKEGSESQKNDDDLIVRVLAHIKSSSLSFRFRPFLYDKKTQESQTDQEPIKIDLSAKPFRRSTCLIRRLLVGARKRLRTKRENRFVCRTNPLVWSDPRKYVSVDNENYFPFCCPSRHQIFSRDVVRQSPDRLSLSRDMSDRPRHQRSRPSPVQRYLCAVCLFRFFPLPLLPLFNLSIDIYICMYPLIYNMYTSVVIFLPLPP